MVDESLKAYLDTTLSGFETLIGLNSKQKHDFVKKLSEVKILDPACGSGAFPMGVLYKMVDMLKTIDPDNSIWKQVQHDKIIGDKIAELEADKKAIQGLSDQQVKAKAIKAVEDRLAELETIFNNEYNFDDYSRKLYIIQNCIYGVDIQDVAIQISKLRFFLSLIVDQKNDDIKPLPNLETKFVIANTLIGIDLPKFTVMGEDDHSQDHTKALKEQLKKVRENYFKATTRKDKLALKAKDKTIREQIANSLADSMNTYKQEDIDKWNAEIAHQKQLIAEAEKMPDMVQEIVVKDLFGGESTTKVNYRKERIKEALAQIRITQTKLDSLTHNTQAEQIRTQALKIAEWDIYNQNAQADWFDAEWMFGLSPEDSNGEIILLNKQIDAINYQIDAINESLYLKLYKISRLQFFVANNQIDVITEQIKSINDNINNLFGTIKNNVNNIVNEPHNFEYEINSLNIRIEKINQELETIKASLKSEQSNGVFDIVIGNPPYVTFKGKEKINISEFELQKLIISHPKSAEYKINSYALFIESGLKLLKNNGNINYIIPSTILQNEYLKNIRKHLILENQLINIISFENKVFEAVTDSIILIAKKGISSNNECKFIKKSNIDFTFNPFKIYDTLKWDNNSNYVINLKTNEIEELILEKCIFDCEYIEDYLEVYVGIVANGIKKFLSDKKLDKNHKKYLQGKHIGNYELKPVELYINFLKDDLHSNTDVNVYNQNQKILVRKTGNILMAMLDDEQYYTDQSLYNLYPKKNIKINLTLLIGLLNSKLLNFYFNKKMITNVDVFPYIKGIHLKQLPIKFPKSQQPFINLVDKILEGKKSGDPTQHWEDEIDVMVYHLYGLSYEEACVIDKELKREDYERYKM